MSDHPLDGLNSRDLRYGGERTVAFDGEILIVSFYRQDSGDFTYESSTRYFRLVEVKQTWEDVKS